MRPIAIFVTMVLVIAAARKAKKKFPSGQGNIVECMAYTAFGERRKGD
jgi:hypothetical protein